MNRYLTSHASKTLPILLVFQISVSALAQEEIQIPLEQIEHSITQALNTDSGQQLLSLCNDSMKKRNPVRDLTHTFSDIRNQLGPSLSLDLIKTEEGNHQFKSTHKIATLLVDIKVDHYGMIDKMSIGPFHNEEGAIDRNTTELILPFLDEWYILWGGKSINDNYHNARRNMFCAFDFIVVDSLGKSHKENHYRNEDFYAFGASILAPADGKVVFVSDSVKDNIWPNINREIPYGNAIMLEISENEYITLAHLKEASILVNEGQHVRQGDILGLCGNSGHSTEPHLHFQLQNSPDLLSGHGAPSYFKRIKVDGQVRSDYSPKKGEKVSN